jgi:hypothetical protein
MVSVLALSAVDRGFEPQSGQTKDYKIGICCFSTTYAALWKKNKDWLELKLCSFFSIHFWLIECVSDCCLISISNCSAMLWREQVNYRWFLPADCFFSELSLKKSNSACWSRTKRTSSSSHRQSTCSRHDIASHCAIDAIYISHI